MSAGTFVAGALLLGTAAVVPARIVHAPAVDTLRVVTTIPDLEDLVERIGGDRVEVESIARGQENIHSVPVKPSSLVSVNRADVFVQIGLSLEHAYVPGLLEAGRNKRIQPGQPGFVNTSAGWEAIDVPAEISRGRSADIHPQGNPHINLSLHGGRFLAQRVLEGLVRVDPGSADAYRARHAAYARELDVAEERWTAARAKLVGRKVVTYHTEFAYFARDTGLVIATTIEARAGVPPTAADLARVIETMKRDDIGVIVTPRWSNNDSVQFIADRTGARIVEVPTMVQTKGEPSTWISLIDILLQRLGNALDP